MKVGQFWFGLLSFVLLMTVGHDLSAGNWNKGSLVGKAGRIPERASVGLDDYKAAYIQYYKGDMNRNSRQVVSAEGETESLDRDLIIDKFAEKQVATTGLFSYLVYQNGKITKDYFSPSQWLGGVIQKNEKFNSQSVGKNVVSYILGHAICEGYIEGLDTKISDWPLMQNTLYSDQKIIDLINMKAGDSRYFRDSEVKMVSPVKNLNNAPLSSWAVLLQDTKKRDFMGTPFNYTGFLSNLIHNYIAFKAGENYDDLLKKVFVDKVGIADDVFFLKQFAPISASSGR